MAAFNRKLLSSVPRKLIDYQWIYVIGRDLSRPVPEARSPVGFTWRFAAAEDFAQDIPGVRLNAGRRKYALELLGQGSICLVAETGGRIVHIRWITFGRLQSDPFDIKLGDGWAYMHRARTDPEFEGRGLNHYGIKRSAEYAAQNGARHTVSLIDETNQRSLGISNRMAGQTLGRVGLIRILGRWQVKRIPAGLLQSLTNPAPR